jgi:SAM-dependent methyltransferase
MLHEALKEVAARAQDVARLDDGEYVEFCRLWHQANSALKDAIYAGPNGGAGRFSREEFENLWGGQSTVFMADILPYLHSKLIQHYRRKQVLNVLDVGAASGFGTSLLASLHRDHSIYSRFEVEAVDISASRMRWIQAMAPDVAFRQADLFDLPSRNWDVVICSHVVEHVREPRPFIEKLRDICRGFAFVYSPHDENPRIPAHVSVITEATYDGLPCELHVIKSMGWHPNRDGDHCLLAVIDCRQP